jgi:hypothetical protein
LFVIEATVKDATVEARHAYRLQEAVPRLRELHAWLLTQRARTATGSALAKAIDYSLKRWQALIRYADSGNLPIDNNVCENNIRPIALGKKLAFYRLREGGCSCRCHSESARHSAIEWCRALCLAQGHAGETAGLAI